MTDPNDSLVPQLTVSSATAAIEFYKNALDFLEISRMATPEGKVMHSELKRGHWRIFVNDAFPEMGPHQTRSPQDLGGSCVTIHLGVPDVDAAFAKAIAAGGKVAFPIADMFWGDRFGKFIDPFGHHWSLSTHKEDVSLDEKKRRAGALLSSWAKQNKSP